ncbi:MAG: hypothetical protein UX99_C0012G0014 [Candidatus Amesbacteria bacterium GW2011_GWB1_47_26]|uniref:PPM-type phosphatase domain-containing protein n=1 Tax=Candidatus Amesbacteria bacterium GW2011_GWC2_45_19 TaxID=1618366 RepID=A0A0G1PBB1_9BACT|nr:MAG: hypothetical protein UX05_C0009G0004 [Candidatus Amesbacteria bacterium GW2011_GWC2_45_19]KKU37744.1 MAG: hypothetical protein UX52_C0019G0006 [Candidatus Amesbacteria bacterium GW2011_GWA1_46_35]KKU69377.1 MAG: hypothetical protein UX93_C0002G0216 [Microgenomates group bacterium GW2011_GWC1_47_20]KKU74529.1 MAG: hypothetical protein UX99_C0012G0014 [Candidatus Amesbacteria bacterium GW2011_GWB1_47_26]
MEIYVGKIVGRISGKRWAQVHDFVHETKGRLIVAASLAVSGEKTEVEMVEMGRELLARVHELYFGNLEEEAMINLKRMVETMETEFEGVEMVVLTAVGEVLYVAANMGGAWAKMKEKEGWVIRPDAEPGVRVLSSWTKNQEILVLGNSRFWEELPLGVVKAAVENNDVEAAVETLGAVVHGGERGEGAVGVVVQLHNDKSEILNSKSQVNLNDQIKKPKINFKLPEIKLPKLRWPSLPRGGGVYVVRGNKDLDRKRMMWAGIGFLVMLMVLVGGWRWSERNKQIKQSEQNKQIEMISEKFNEAKAVVTLNPARSRELLKEIDPEVQKLKNSKTQSKDKRVMQIVGEWEGVWNEAMGTKVAQPELVLDLGLVREGMVGEKLEMRDGKLVVLDTQGDRLIEVNPGKKSAEVVAGKNDLGEARLLATYPGKTVVLSDKGIVECQGLGAKCQVVVKPDDGWGEIVDMGMWGGNIYLLSKAGIWKHQGGEGGYGAKQSWLSEAGDYLGMAIDGSVWITEIRNEKLEIRKYTRGVKESFEVSGVEGLEGEVIYTDDETEKLYVLDTAGGRIVVLAKTGEYESQYVNEAIKGATGLVVDEKTGKIYLLAGSKVYVIKL